MNDEEKLAIENLKRLSETKPFIIWVDGTPYNKSNQIYTILNLIEKQDKIINEMADEMADIDYDYESRGREMRTCCSKDCPKTDSRIIGQLCEWWYPYGNKTKCETMFKHWLENYDDVKKIHNEYLKKVGE